MHEDYSFQFENYCRDIKVVVKFNKKNFFLFSPPNLVWSTVQNTKYSVLFLSEIVLVSLLGVN